MSEINTPVLVTGGTGFIGRHVIDKLLAKGLEVASFALPGEGVPEHWGHRVNVIRGDITKAEDVRNAMRGIRTVIHLAASVVGGDFESHWRVTVEGSRNLFDAALAEGAKVVLTSSITVYGELIAEGVCHDGLEQGRHFHGPYSRAKMAQETLALEYQNDKNLSLVVIRPANVYGNGSVWVDVMSQLISANVFAIVGDGSGDAGLVHGSNLADAIILAAAKPEAVGEIFTVADEFGVTWRQYFNDLAKFQGKAPLPQIPLDTALEQAQTIDEVANLEMPTSPAPFSLEMLSMVGYANRFDSSKIREKLGWTPQTSYDEGIASAKTHVASLNLAN